MDETVSMDQGAEMIVPDSYPDIAHIVDTSGVACLKDKALYADRLELNGLCKAGVLYTPEGETGLRKIDVNVPFTRTFDGAMESSPVAVANVRVLQADARMINPRKVQVSVTMLIEVKVYSRKTLELTDEVVGPPGESSCEVLKNAENAWLLTSIQNKPVTLNEEIEIPTSRAAIDEILKADVRLVPGEMKIIGAKVVFKGLATVRLLYTAMGRPYSVEQEYPFSQIIEIDGAEEGANLEAALQLAGLDIDFLPGGDARKLAVVLYVDVTVLAFADMRIETVSDVYGIGASIKPDIKALGLKAIDERTSRRQSVRESIDVGDEVGEVIDSSVVIGPVISHDGKTGCDCTVKVVYHTEGGRYENTSRSMHVPCPAEEAIPGELSAQLSGEVVASPTAGGIEVRFGVDFDMVHVRECKLLSVVNVTEEPEEPKQDTGKICNVILRRCRKGESLWDIAKRFGSTRAELAHCNKLETIDDAPEGKVLLIPRKRC
jgi:hypothetical protein